MDVRFPKIGDGADSGKVVSVLVKVGETITAGQSIIELETGKAIAPIPATTGGKITAILVQEGDTINVGFVLLTVDGAPATAAAPKPAPAPKATKRTLAPTPDFTDDEVEASDGEGGADVGPIPAASPYVRKVARELGFKLGRVHGSGSGGRVQIEDLARYVSKLEGKVARAGRYAAEPQGLSFPLVGTDFSLFGPVVSEPLSHLRKIIAARMVENQVTVAHVTQFDDADLTTIETLRAKYKVAYEKAGAKLSPTPFIIKALVSVLKQHPKFNASINEVAQTLVLKQYYHMGIAVDTDAGLLVPVLRDADQKSLLDLAQELHAIAEKARDRKLGPDAMTGGSFTISNQGAIGGGHFTPIVNKPEVAILGLGKTAKKPVVIGDKVEIRPMMPVAVSYDHRIIDGGGAARFVVDLVKAIQEFPETAVKL